MADFICNILGLLRRDCYFERKYIPHNMLRLVFVSLVRLNSHEQSRIYKRQS